MSEPPAVAGGQFVIIAPMISDQEELEEVRAYDNAKSSIDQAIPLAQAIKEIEDDLVS